MCYQVLLAQLSQSNHHNFLQQLIFPPTNNRQQVPRTGAQWHANHVFIATLVLCGHGNQIRVSEKESPTCVAKSSKCNLTYFVIIITHKFLDAVFTYHVTVVSLHNTVCVCVNILRGSLSFYASTSG